MYQLTALYDHPQDPAAFDRHYEENHAPLAGKIPGLQRYTWIRPAPGPDGTPPAYHLVAVLEFESEAAFGAALGGPEGQAVVADLANFAQAGVTLLSGEATSI